MGEVVTRPEVGSVYRWRAGLNASLRQDDGWPWIVLSVVDDPDQELIIDVATVRPWGETERMGVSRFMFEKDWEPV